MAGFKAVPAIVRDLSDSESLEISLIENLQRENLNPLDAAEAYDTLIKKFSYTHDLLAQRLGKDRSSITNQLRLLKLPDPIKEDLRHERLTMGHARTLLAIENLPKQLTLSRKTVSQKLSVRDLERIVQNYKANQTHREGKPGVRETGNSILERGLSRHLSTRVVIKYNSNNSGRLEIYFHSPDELDRLVEALGYSEDFS
jgi:ParB family chromosome partitioning protein